MARTREAALRHRKSARLLGRVASCLNVEVPRPSEFVPSSKKWPFGAHVAPWLEGEQVDGTVNPESVAEFMAQLHGIEPAMMTDIAGSYHRWCTRQRSIEVRGLENLDGRLERGLLSDMADFMSGADLEDSDRRALIHGDLWYANMLMRTGRLTGVLDWDDAAIGDPAADYAGLWYLGDDFATTVLSRLGAAPDFRVVYFRLLRELSGVVWSVRHDDTEELAESIVKTDRLARALLA